MNFKISFSLSIIFLLFFSVSSAQIDLGRIAKKAEKKVERKIDKKITKGVNKAIDETDDAISGKNKKKKNDKGKTKVITETKIVKEVIPHAFRGEFMMNITKAEGNNMIKIALSEYQTAVRPLIIKEPNNLMIYNKKDETLTSINNVKYKGKALKEWMIRNNDNNKNRKEILTLTKTTDIQEFNGFIARKYIVDGNGVEGIMWLTKEIDADFNLICELMGYNNYNFSNSYGFPLVIDVTLKGGTKEYIAVDNIVENNSNSSLFDISAYELIDMTDLEPGN